MASGCHGDCFNLYNAPKSFDELIELSIGEEIYTYRTHHYYYIVICIILRLVITAPHRIIFFVL